MKRNKLKITGLMLIIAMLAAVIFAFSITASAEEGDEDHVHDMADATCTTPATCKTCGEAEGYALTHSWVDSEIQGKKECTRCGELLLPDFDFVTRPYATLAETGFDAEQMLSIFPNVIETKYENGKYMIKDIGAFGAEYFNSIDYSRAQMTLEDGYWTIEVSKEEYDAVIEAGERFGVNFYSEDYFWQIVYRNGRIADVLQIATPGNVYVAMMQTGWDVVDFVYPISDRHYGDSYENGVLREQQVSVWDDDYQITAYYFPDGTLNYVSLYIYSEGEFYYYVQGFGWANNPSGDPEYACEAPTGYEDIDETYFTANMPSLICSEAEGDDIVHDMEKAFCTTLFTCKNGCGHTEGTIEHHDWQIVNGEKVCSVCDAVFFPEFEYVDRVYPTVEEAGFPYAEYRALFPDVLTVKYEDGKYMVKDVGADRAEACISTDPYVEIPLVDGWWIFELDEEVYNDENTEVFVTFRGELNGGLWNINYRNGEVNGSMYMESENTTPSVRVYYAEYDWVCFEYYVGGRKYTDGYTNGVFSSQDVIARYNDDDLQIYYLADGTVESILINIDGNWFYYYSDRGWENGNGEPIDAPEGYEDAEFLASVAPTTINCVHEKYSEADCTNPEYCLVCGIAKEGSEALGHDWIDATYDSPKTCYLCGETEGEPLEKETEIETVTETDIETEGEGGNGGNNKPNGGGSNKPNENNKPDGGENGEEVTTKGEKNEAPEKIETEKYENEATTEAEKPDGGENGGDKTEKGRCGSSIGFGAVAIVAILSAAVVFKKKED